MKILGILTQIVAVLIGISFLVGFYIMQIEDDEALGDRIIGLTVLASVFFLLPMFLVLRWRGKKLKDYTLSDENLKKMNDRKKK
jgi:membrane protein CcdC involved in cytochrome C biogenesis